MARKTDRILIKDFTKNIHSTRRSNTGFSKLENWCEKEAKEQRRVCCKDCRHFNGGCSEYIGRYHKPCIEFEWD